MQRSFTLDRKSFEECLAATFFIQQLREPVEQGSVTSQIGHPLILLLQLQQAIRSKRLDLDSVLSRIVSLAQSALGANFAGIWLVGNTNRFSCCARAGSHSDEERLGMEVLASLGEYLKEESYSPKRIEPNFQNRSCYPGCPKSIAIVPLRLNRDVVGGFAAFSPEFEAFRARDLDNLTLLARLCEQTLDTAVRSGYQNITALQSIGIVDLLERLQEQVNRLEERSCSAASSNACTSEPLHAEESDLELVKSGPLLPLQQPVPCLEGEHKTAFLANSRESDSLESDSCFVVKMTNHFSGNNGCELECGRRTNRFTIHRFGLRFLDVGALISTFCSARKVFACWFIFWAQRYSTCAKDLRRYRFTLGFVQVRPLVAHMRNSVSKLTHRRVTVRITGLPSFSGFATQMLGLRNLGAPLSNRLSYAKYSILNAVKEVPRLRFSSLKLALGYRGRLFVAAAEHGTNHILTKVQKIGERLSVVRVPTVNTRALRKSGGALAIMTMMTSFLLLQVSVRTHLHSEAPSPSMHPELSAPPAASRLMSASMRDRNEAFTAGPSSHLAITDGRVAEALHELTRYEILTLQRTRDSGDADENFELGMAYETGYYVRQNCTKAAHWVRVAAEEGSAAAEYNLGLRYRYGDGVAIDYSIAEHWLKKAAAQEYSPAKLP